METILTALAHWWQANWPIGLLCTLPLFLGWFIGRVLYSGWKERCEKCERKIGEVESKLAKARSAYKDIDAKAQLEINP